MDDLDKLFVRLFFNVWIPLTVDDCKPTMYSFHTQGVLFFHEPIFSEQNVCAEYLVSCGGACVDVQRDAQHCGACFTSCDTGKECVHGTCRKPELCGYVTAYPFDSDQWYRSGDTLNRCRCDHGTWETMTGKFCKNWD